MIRVKKGWVIAGILVMQLMLLAAAFSLGVYLERYGLTEEGLAYQRSPANFNHSPQAGGQATPRPGQGQSLPPGLSVPPQIIGHILQIQPGQLEIASPQGPRTITINEDTIYRDYQDTRLAYRDLKPRDAIAVYGHLEDAGRVFIATEIVVLPPEPDDLP
nr:hypothetical protein [Anaerolineae bacterium]